MSDLVKLRSKTDFQNPRIPNGKGGLVTVGDEFETDPFHARELVQLGHAEPVSGTVDDFPEAPLEAHHSVSQRVLDADRARRASRGGASAPTNGTGGAQPDDGLDKLTQQQLRKILDDEKIDEGQAQTKGDVVAVIRAARAQRQAA